MAVAASLAFRTITVDSHATTLTGNIPSEAAAGTKLFIAVTNESDRNVSAMTFDAGSATLLETSGASVLKLAIGVYEIDAADVTAGTFTVTTSGTGNHSIIVHAIGDVDIAAFTDFVLTNANQFHMHGPTQSDSGDTDQKLWVDVHCAGKSGSFVAQANTYDYTDTGHYLDDGVSISGMAFYLGWRLDISQTRGRIGPEPPYSAYHEMASNSTMIGYRVFFDTQDDANWPIVATAVTTGTLATEAGVVAGSQTIIITLGLDTWAATVGDDVTLTQDLIDGIDSDVAEALGWDTLVRPLITFANVVRTSASIVTITLPAAALYAITGDEIITVTVPASAVSGAGEIIATSPLTITDDPALPVAAGGGASTADLGVSNRRSGAARRRIVDLDDPRRKYRLPY